ncbi:inositol monophosphatase family protein [Alteribacter natronophilus]|uniref:inositol monophosphatase family protein n=1 Tax=Alteribacter natronophilus TaxID=2583810 RepID=UPI00110F32EB|nr:inositol monophosphatase [Alteribacter natronophilus]TMW70448.1 inositol monophosphatase [Alteribacter natronophilus]
MERTEIYRSACNWAEQAGKMLTASLENERKVEYKTSAADLVTEMDRAVEEFFAEKIKETYPDHFILGEEGTVSGQKDYTCEQETVWLIDPVDGTTNFVHQKRNFAVSVAVFHKGTPVAGVIYDPVAKEMFHALKGEGAWLNERKMPGLKEVSLKEALVAMNSLWLAPNDYVDCEKMQRLTTTVRGVRCQGSAALELAHVACGRLDASVAMGLGPWDFGAALVILEEAGATVTAKSGEAVFPFAPSSVIAARPGLHEKLISDYFIQP